MEFSTRGCEFFRGGQVGTVTGLNIRLAEGGGGLKHEEWREGTRLEGDGVVACDTM